MKKRSGFTLIELLIVIGIIAILAGIVIIAVNPTKQFGEANDAQRTSDLGNILDAVSQAAIDERGVLPTFISDLENDTPTAIASAVADSAGDLFCELLVPKYISAMPTDPTDPDASYTGSCDVYDTGYTIEKDANNRITVKAPTTEQNFADDGTTIVPLSITR